MSDTVSASPAMKGRSFHDYRAFIRDHYDGPAGALTSLTGLVTGHEALAGRLFRPEAFDVRGCKRLLDAACGNGRYLKYLHENADEDAALSAFDLSEAMLRRARRQTASDRVAYAVADLTRLPYPTGYFDAVVCGWALEHLPDPVLGLRELARVLAPGGKFLLLTTENTISGWLCSWMWHCRTYGRAELRRACEASGLRWHREMWFSGLHRRLGMGGIVVELRRQETGNG